MASLNLKDRLKRIAYLNYVDHPQFFVGNPDQYQHIVSKIRYITMQEVIQDDFKELFAVLDAANTDNNLPRRSVIFYILAKFLSIYTETSAEQKSKITEKVLELIQSDEDFFTFIKYYTEYDRSSKMPSSVAKLVRKFYGNKSPLELAQSVAKYNKMYKWSHKDLIKLSHFKSDTPLKNLVVKYILTRKVSDKASEEEMDVLNIIIKSDELRKTKEHVDAIPIISSLKFTMNQVSSSLHQNVEVWSAAVQNMSIKEILPCLGKLYKLGLLKVNTTISNHVVDLVTSQEKVRASGVHPIEVLTFMKRLEKGGKPLDLHLLHYLQNEKKLTEADLKKAQTRIEAKSPHILNALLKCFDLACNNVSSTNKRYLMTIDVTSEAKKSLCIGNKVLTFLEAAVAYAILLLRVEKDVVLATYNGDKVNILSVEKKISFSDLFEKVKARNSTYSLLSAGVEWAASEKKHVDVFVNFIHNEFAAKAPKEKNVSLSRVRCETITKYRTKVNLPSSKFITFAPVKRFLAVPTDLPPNVLDILGFDAVACKVVECFSRGSFC